MIQDSIKMTRSLSGITPFIFFQDGPGAAGYFETIAPEILSTPQRGENLGMRMKNAFDEIFGRGFTEVAIIGTDSPDLPVEHIFEAFSLLEYEHTDVVFGPAEDGGYYLLALKRVWDGLFTGLPWSSETLLSESVEAAKDLCLGASFLPTWHDIDTAADLKRPELLDEKTTSIKTREFLAAISDHFSTST
jgi:rSAM/selenodomain-associated transferase 1